MNNVKISIAARALAMGVAALVLVGMAGTGAAVSGLVAEYHFDGNAQDTSGNGNHGTINGATFVQGISGQALSFNGNNDYVNIGDPVSGVLDFGATDSFTLTAFFNSNAFSGKTRAIIQKWTTPPNKGYYLRFQIEDGNLRFHILDESDGGTNPMVTYATSNFATGTWYHVAAVRDVAANKLRLYVNGIEVASVTSISKSTSNSGDLRIGSGYGSGIDNFDGAVDEVRIYNRALTASEIQAEYNAVISPPPTTVPPTTVPPTTVPPTTVPPTTVPPTTVPPTTVPPTTVPPTTVPPTTVSPTITTPAPPKFRVGPSVTLRPVNDVIEENQDGIVELFMNNPSLNDVTLNVDAQVSVPAGLHVSGENFGESAGAGVVAGTFSVPPGKARTISITIKADKSARTGSHTLQFTGLYYPDGNKDAFQPISLTYAVTVERPSKETPTAIPTATPKEPGFEVILAGIGIILALAHRRR